VSIDGPGIPQRIKSFIDRMGITYTILHDPDDKFSRAFRTIGVPESFLINGDGNIVHNWKGPFDAMSEDTQAMVTSLLVGEASGQMKQSSTSGASEIQNQTSSQLQTSQKSLNEDDISDVSSTSDPEGSAANTNCCSSQKCNPCW
jgi:cytochrome c-type biogenesis protein